MAIYLKLTERRENVARVQCVTIKSQLFTGLRCPFTLKKAEAEINKTGHFNEYHSVTKITVSISEGNFLFQGDYSVGKIYFSLLFVIKTRYSMTPILCALSRVLSFHANIFSLLRYCVHTFTVDSIY